MQKLHAMVTLIRVRDTTEPYASKGWYELRVDSNDCLGSHIPGEPVYDRENREAGRTPHRCANEEGTDIPLDVTGNFVVMPAERGDKPCCNHQLCKVVSEGSDLPEGCILLASMMLTRVMKPKKTRDLLVSR